MVDLVAAVNYEKVIDRSNIQSEYETSTAIIGITIRETGISPFEVYGNSSFTKDLGAD